MRGTILGLEIGKKGLSALVIEKRLKGFAIKESGYVEYDDPAKSPGTGESDSINSNGNRADNICFNHVLFKKALNDLASQIDISKCFTAAVSLSACFFSFRNIELPFKSKSKIKQVLSFELQPFLPLMDENYVSDFIVSDFPGENENSEILTASIPASTIDSFFLPLKEFGLNPELITPSGYAAAEYFQKKYKNHENQVYIHVTENSVVILLSIKGKIVLIRSPGIKKSNRAVVQAVEQTIMGFKQRSGFDFSPEKSFVSWGSEKDETLLNELKESLQCAVQHADAAGLVHFSSLTADNHLDVNALCAALSLAESRDSLNLCRGAYAADSFFSKYRNKFAAIFFLSVTIFTALLFNIYADISNSEKKAAELENAAAAVLKKSFPNVTKVVDPLMQMKVNVSLAKEKAQKRSGSLNTRDGTAGYTSFKAIDILFELSEKIPDSIKMETDRLVLNPGRIIFSGTTDGFNNVDRIKSFIEKSDMFKQVNISSAAADKTGKKVRFKFIIDI